MTQRISILPEIITNKIAAGEVVERPASVIKELLENSLDAGATEISVEIAAGGRRLINITDNGHGMSRSDALLSLERHATSKIRTDSDLDGILTLGFRGEALPSIASVSRFRLATREAESLEGIEITVEGGKVRDVKACGMAPGTVIQVEQLFFNTPARLKFLRSAETEAARAADSVVRMALSRPDVAFSCISDGRELMRVQRGDLKRRLVQLLGRDSADALYAIDCSAGGVNVTGYISAPQLVRSTTAGMFTYINGRFVRDRVIQHAIMQAYRGVIDRGRYPVVALFITLAPGEVDVNVHPTKHEVRFRRQSDVHDALHSAIEGTLKSSPWLAGQPQNRITTTNQQTGQTYRERIAAAAQASLDINRNSVDRGFHGSDGVHTKPQPTQPQPAVINEPAEPFDSGSEKSPEQAGFFSSLSVIGQFHAEYILCQSGDQLIIIDQHAASERVAYQRLKGQCRAGGVESQRLLFPETVELTFSEAATAKRFQKDLTLIGFELDPFGGTTMMISAIPRILEASAGIQLLRDILAELNQLDTSTAFQEALDNLLSRVACHSVVRGVHTLGTQQITELLRSMDETDFAASCPHGRPVLHKITLFELEKIFKRR